MTIYKFGRHIHKHIKRHLMDEDVLMDFLKHPKIKKVLEMRTENIPTKYIIQIFSDGNISGRLSAYLPVSKSKNVTIYENKLYEGKVVNVQYSHKSLTSLVIDGKQFDPTKPHTLKRGARFILKYIGPMPVPKQTEPVSIEVVIEGNVS